LVSYGEFSLGIRHLRQILPSLGSKIACAVDQVSPSSCSEHMQSNAASPT